jgi:hypothetical protein
MDPPLEGSRIRTIGTAWRDQGFQRGSSRLCSISCQRKSWRERQPIPRRRRAPSAGPIVRILFPPAKSLRTFRSLLESPRTPAVIVEAPVNGTDAANVRFNAWQFRQILGRGVHGVLLYQAESAAAVRRLSKAAAIPISPPGSIPPCLRLPSGCAAQPESRARAASGSARASVALKPLQPRSGGCRRKNTCSAAIPGRSTRTASCCSASPRRDCDRAGQSGLVLGRYLHPDGQGLPLPRGSCRNVFYRRRNRDLSGTTPSPPDTDPPNCALIS